MFVTQFVPVQKTTDVTATFKGEKALALENRPMSYGYGDSSSYILL